MDGAYFNKIGSTLLNSNYSYYKIENNIKE